MSRSCGIPDLIHIKNERHLGMDGTRGDRSRWAPNGPAPCCLDGNPPQEYPGMSRNRVILFIRMSISRLEALQHLSKRGAVGLDQRPGRLISGTQSFRRRLSSQNRCSFSRAGSSQVPSAGFCSNRKRGDTSVTRVYRGASYKHNSKMIHGGTRWSTELYIP